MPTASDLWPSQPPEDCPFPASADFAGLAFTGRHAEYTKSDTWYPSWAADGNLYSPYMDGWVRDAAGAKIAHQDCGVARILGNDPLQLAVEPIVGGPRGDPNRGAGFDCLTQLGFHGPLMDCDGTSYHHGMYTCCSLIHDGVWYVGAETRNSVFGKGPDGKRYNPAGMGPFLFFRYSEDAGRTWRTAPHHRAPFVADAHGTVGYQPLFPEPPYFWGPVRFPVPHFVDFGQEMTGSPDGYAYVLSHGNSEDQWLRFGSLSWNMGDEVYAARTRPSIATINQVSAWEFFAGHDAAGRPTWSPDFAATRPVFAWRGHTGCACATWIPGLRRYLLVVGDGFHHGIGPSSTYVLESEAITGPWRLVTYLRHFGPQAYFTNIPSKFIAADGESFWLCYSANYLDWQQAGPPNPPGSDYAMCMQEVRLRRR